MLAMVDLDGTLIDTKDINYAAYKMALEESGYNDLRYDQFCNDFNGLNYKIFLRIIDPDMSFELMEKIHNRKAELYPSFMKNGKLNESLVAMLAALKASGWKIALVSAANRKNILDALKRFSVVGLFDEIVAQESVKKTKPNPECFFYTMKLFNEDPYTSIIFEDSKTGIMAAEQTGCKFYIVKGYN